MNFKAKKSTINPKISISLGGNNIKKNVQNVTTAKKKYSLPKKTRNILNESGSESDDEQEIEMIQNFTKDTLGKSAKIVKNKDLIIVPKNGVKRSLIKMPKSGMREASSLLTNRPNVPTDNASELYEQDNDNEDYARAAIINGTSIDGDLIISQKNGLEDEPAEASEDMYNEVPVADFGAAMLRGMGWKPNKESKNKLVTASLIRQRKQGDILGIGAKPIEAELQADLETRNNKYKVPLIRKSS